LSPESKHTQTYRKKEKHTCIKLNCRKVNCKKVNTLRKINKLAEKVNTLAEREQQGFGATH
jgi:hypothetical protein